MKTLALALGLAVVGLPAAACTTIPDRFAEDLSTDGHGGCVVSSEDAAGIDLEVFWRAYSFLPAADDEILEARAFFRATAERLARERGKAHAPIRDADLGVTATRNMLDGRYSIYVAGRVVFAP